MTAIIDADGYPVVTYHYDPWGEILSISGSMATTLGVHNPLLYRGYVYDHETGLYYLQSRYYNPDLRRFINADTFISGDSGMLMGYNLFAYCFNNPVNMSDFTGCWPRAMSNVSNWASDTPPVKEYFSPQIQNKNIVYNSSHNANRRPNTGEPGSTYVAPNGDTRTYGPDGNPEHDYDHDDHGRPDKHPHDSNGGHNHNWNNGVRGPAYRSGLEPVAGVALVAVCVVGIAIVAIDDVTGVGVADDFLFAPLGAGIGKGLILIFG